MNTHETLVHKVLFLLKISVSDIKPLTYLMWPRQTSYTLTLLLPLYTYHNICIIRRVKRQVPERFNYTFDWLILPLWTRLIVLSVSVTAQLHAHVIHSRSAFRIFCMSFPQRCGSLFKDILASFHSFLVRLGGSCCEMNSSQWCYLSFKLVKGLALPDMSWKCKKD